jgi:uncharacterized protein (DUF1778 family)
MGETRSEWLQPRPPQIIEAGAESKHETITEKMVRCAISAAKENLADRRYFTIDGAACVEFNALLDRPPVYKPRLKRLLSLPAPWRD